MQSGINRHFSRESKIILALSLAPLALGLLVALVWPHVDAWLEVDRCLDAGGKYDHSSSVCVFADSDPR